MVAITPKVQHCVNLAKECNEGRCPCDKEFISCPFEDGDDDCDDVTWEHWYNKYDMCKHWKV